MMVIFPCLTQQQGLFASGAQQDLQMCMFALSCPKCRRTTQQATTASKQLAHSRLACLPGRKHHRFVIKRLYKAIPACQCLDAADMLRERRKALRHCLQTLYAFPSTCLPAKASTQSCANDIPRYLRLSV